MRKFTLFLMSLFLSVGVMAQEYSTTGGNTYKDNYLKSITSTGAVENISYSASSHPGSIHNLIPGKIVVLKGESFTIKFVANSLGSSSSWLVREDIRYCHASLFTDFDGDKVFGDAQHRWGNKPPTHHIKGNYDECMNISTTISVPADAASGTSRIRIVYTNAWGDWPSADATNLDKGIAYDIEVEVIDPAVRTDYIHNTGHMNRKQGEERGLTSFTLTDGTNSLEVSNIQDVNSRTAAVYVDKSAQKLTTKQGATLKFTDFNYTGSWMHAYAYIDYNNDFEFNLTNNNNGEGEGEIVSYNYYNGNDITGTPANQGSAIGNTYGESKAMPAFTLPRTLPAGEYRVRIKIDWNNLDADYGADDIAVNGGCQCDFTIVVEEAVGNEIAWDALNNAVDEALALFDAVKIGTSVGSYSSSIDGYEAKFNDIMTFKNSITKDTPADEIDAMTERLREIIASFSLNMPKAGDYIRIKSIEGWNNDARYLGAQNSTVKTSRAEFVAEAGANTIFYFDGENLISYASGNYLVNNSSFLGYNGVQADGTVVEFRTSNNTSNRHAYNISFIGNDSATRWLYTNTANHTDAGSSCGTEGGYNFNLEPVTELPVTVTAAGYATFYAPVAVTIPSGVTAHTVTINGEWASLSEALTVVPAETGVVLVAGEGSHSLAITTTDATAASALVGTTAATYIAADAYVLSNGKNGVGFYGAILNQVGNTAFLNNSHKAYLPMTDGMNAASYSFRFEEGTTGINEVKGENGEVKAIFDLTGRRVEAITAPGIYIVNGKKVLVK